MAEPDSEVRFVPEANRLPDPRRIDITVPDSGSAGKVTLPGGVEIDPSKPAAYLCIGMTCLPPIADPAELRETLTAASAL
jgi:uncharacterized protein YyaL (SSP411 family)